MAIRINTNLFSLFVNRNLARAGQRLEESFKRLGSGEKINKSGDDPAGLANSHALRNKISGLQRNLINGNEGLNVTNVAESALGTVSEILQRLRELAVQAATATTSNDQRDLIQKEVTSLLDEIQRIATTANYNDKILLDGTFKDLRLQVGTRSGQSIPISIENTQTSVLGSVARVTGALPVDDQPIAGSGDLTINSKVVPATAADGVSTVNNTASAIAKAKAINAITNLTGVTAKVEATVAAGAGAVGAGSLNGTTSALIINGTNVGAVDFLAHDSNVALRERINSYSTLTGVTASLGGSGELVLTAADGRNVEITASGDAVSALGLAAGTSVVGGTLTLTSPNTIQVGGTAARIGFLPGQSTTFVDPDTAIEHLKMTTQDDAEEALERIDVAIQQVLGRRATLGAIQSRIDQTLDDISVNIENLTAADSRIRDADFAVETAEMTQAQIIQQAGVAILAQANVIPSMALSLLQKQ